MPLHVLQLGPYPPPEGGISHNEIENARPEHIAAGCNVLLHAVLRRAEQA